MVAFIIMLMVLCFVSVYVLIEFSGYLKKFHALKWKELSFEQPLGIPQEDLYFYPIRPLKFIPFLFADNDINDKNVTTYKTLLKLSFLGIVFLSLICVFI